MVAVGERGIVMLSDDDGRNWRQAKVPLRVTLTAVHFVDARKGWAVGHFGVVLHSEDGGETWSKQFDGRLAAQLILDHAKSKAPQGGGETPKRDLADAQQLVDDGPDKPFLDVYFENERAGFIVGAYNLIFTTRDGGNSWLPWQEHIDNPGGLHLYAIRKLGNRYFIAGEKGTFYQSSDRGNKFVRLPTPYDGSYFGLLPTRSGEIIAFGLRGNAFKSGDGGKSWKRIETGTPASLVAGIALDGGALVLVNQIGQVLASIDNGTSFLQTLGSVPSNAGGISQAADGGLVVVGVGGARHIDIGRLPVVSTKVGELRGAR